MPSIWWENAPLVIHEARAAGRPVICSGIGGMAELVEDGVDRPARPAGRRRGARRDHAARRGRPRPLGPPGAARSRRRATPPSSTPTSASTTACATGWPHDPCRRRRFRPRDSPARAVLRDGCAILLHGGRVLLTFVCGERPPATGHLVQRDEPVALDRRMLAAGTARTTGTASRSSTRLPPADAEVRSAASAGPLAARRGAAARRRPGAAGRARPQGRGQRAARSSASWSGTSWPNARPTRPRRSRTAASPAPSSPRRPSHDGFIEIVGAPDTGGYFAQGWSMSLQPGTHVLADASEDLALREVEVARLRARRHPAAGPGLLPLRQVLERRRPRAPGPVFFERDGQLLRLDVRPRTACCTSPPSARARARRAHAAAAPRARRRRSRPSAASAARASPASTPSRRAAAPIAAACDAVLQAPDGTLLVTGWLLDPLRRVERVLLKSTANLYAQLDTAWCPLPRPDLVARLRPGSALRRPPRRARRDARLHRPRAGAPASETDGAEVYLELVLDDGSCLFRPLAVTPFASAERLPQLLRSLSPAEPELARIIESHLAPFLASVRPAVALRRRGAAIRALPLGDGTGDKRVTAVMPFRSLRRAAADPRAPRRHPRGRGARPRPRHRRATVVGDAGEARRRLRLLRPHRRPRGRQRRREPPPRSSTSASRPRAAPACSPGSPSALPKAPGWLARLLDEADGAAGPRPPLAGAHLRGRLDLLRRRHRPARRLAARAAPPRPRRPPAPPRSR